MKNHPGVRVSRHLKQQLKIKEFGKFFKIFPEKNDFIKYANYSLDDLENYRKQYRGYAKNDPDDMINTHVYFKE